VRGLAASFGRHTSTSSEPPVHKFAWVPFDPSKELVELANMLHLRLGSVPLQGTDEHHNFKTGVGKVGYGTKQGPVELMQLWCAKVLWLGVLKLSMDNRPKITNKN
jgi:hypothetical protein